MGDREGAGNGAALGIVGVREGVGADKWASIREQNVKVVREGVEGWKLGRAREEVGCLFIYFLFDYS